ncbi:MAG: insulinase family protein [Candidatus Eisenbacteria bacterium]|uniref:Insulinase family protein n=1 Tax=Eiseniibacteriota bacterium TaxID=2212470 RepID=A0A849SBW8_UNCEI|nr:insulinase family protein [Candidatus Eisenbacteria bacterium]
MIGCIAAFAGCDPAPSSGPPHVALAFETYTLPNGLEVILRRDARLPIAAVNLWYHVGPANEAAGRTGFAHLFEHMMFQASGHVPEDQYFAILEGAGSSFVNATTDFDRTNYLEDVPSNQLELALWLESDRMGFLLDRLDAASLANQQDVVRNERREAVENTPYQLAEERLFQRLFPKEHPYYAWVIGSHDDIQAAKLEDVREFFRSFYGPNNASLAIVGDIDVAQTKQWVDKYFGTLARGPEVAVPTAKAPVITSEVRDTVPDRIELPKVLMGWITPNAFQPGDAEAIVTARLLGGGKSSRLYRSLVYDQKIAQSVSASQQSLSLGSVFEVTLTAKPGHSAAELEQQFDGELGRFASEGPSAAELRAAKTALYSQMVEQLQHVGGLDGVANAFNRYNQYVQDPGFLQKDLERLDAVTASGVKRFVTEQLARDRRVVIHCIPGEKRLPPGPPTPAAPAKSDQTIVSAEPWRNERPKAGALSTTPLPAPLQFQLENGLTVLLVEQHGLPVVAAELVVRSGSAADPTAQPGLAGFTASMLDEGAGKRDALGIARELEALGASLGTIAYTDGSVASVSSLKGQAAAALGIMADVVTSPTFPAGEVDRVRNDRLTALVEQESQPMQTAMRVMARCVFGQAHPYGHLSLGSSDALKAIRREDLEAFYRGSYSPRNAALVLAGDLTESEARRLARGAFGSWSGDAPQSPAPGAGEPTDVRITVVDLPGASQTALVCAQPAVARSDPDYEKLNIMNQVLGGLVSSRVNINLREKHGYSYGAFSFIRENRGVAPLVVGAMVRGDATAPALREIMLEVAGMKARPMSTAELELARESIARGLPALFETAADVSGTVSWLFLYDQSLDYYAKMPERLASLTPASVFEATQRVLDPDAMRVIAVGDRKSIEPALVRLGLGVVTTRNSQGGEPIRP